jgi:hypothetical protein
LKNHRERNVEVLGIQLLDCSMEHSHKRKKQQLAHSVRGR